MMNIQEAAQKYHYKELKNAKIALGRADRLAKSKTVREAVAQVVKDNATDS